MSTRSTIAIVLSDKDRSAEKLMRKVWENAASYQECSVSPEGKPVLYDYCHFDGYLEGVGAALQGYYNNYEAALDLVLCGALSYVNDSGACPYVCRGEAWEDNIPVAADYPYSYGYMYCFYNGDWYVYNDDNAELDDKSLELDKNPAWDKLADVLK